MDHEIGPFALTTQTGDRLRATDLRGRVHVAPFIFTGCAGICPMMVEQLMRVQTATAADPAGVVMAPISGEARSPHRAGRV